MSEQASEPLVFGGTIHHDFDQRILDIVSQKKGGEPLRFSHCWHSLWADREPGFRLEKPMKVEGKHVIIFTCPITFKHESELKDLVTACAQQYGAKTVTVVMAFLRYRRQDRPEHVHEITRLRWFLRDLRHWGANRLIVCEPHAEKTTRKFAEEYGLELFVADPTRLIASKLESIVEAESCREDCLVYSPDFGSIGRAIKLARQLKIDILASPKQRFAGEVHMIEDSTFITRAQEEFGTEVSLSCDLTCADGKVIIMRDDELDSGSTATKTARELRGLGAKAIYFVGTHPVCSPGWKPRLFPHGVPHPFTTVWLGNTRPRGFGESSYEGSTGNRVQTISMEPVLAEELLRVFPLLT